VKWEDDCIVSSEWINKIVQDRRAQRELQKQTQEQARIGRTQAPNLFRMLKDQVERDVADFNREESGYALQFTFVPSSIFSVRYNNFPVISLDVELALDAGTMSYKRIEKSSASADTITAEEGTIFIMSGSNADQAYYSIKGREFREQAEVSAFLLSPVFRAVP
jgi:hypothetical protein